MILHCGLLLINGMIPRKSEISNKELSNGQCTKMMGRQVRLFVLNKKLQNRSFLLENLDCGMKIIENKKLGFNCV